MKLILSQGWTDADLDALVRAAKAPRTDAQRGDLDARLRSYEATYGFPSSELRARLANGRVADTCDTSKWLFLLRTVERGPQ